jgi:uncharacterized DUF497 family protein
MASIWMGLLEVEWDDEKAASNLQKHGISFPEAATVFQDEEGLYEYDEGHSELEDRFHLIGVSSRRRMMVVIHVERAALRIRIISAREPTESERRRYEQGLAG